MIDSIAVKNYKAFKEAEFEIKPITLLLGANSVGKSSLLQLLLLLKQTATFGTNTDNVPLKMYGPFTNMGSIENLFHNKNSKVILEFSVSFKNEKLLKEITEIRKDFIKFIYSIPYFLPIKELLKIRQNIRDIGIMTKELNKISRDKAEFIQYARTITGILKSNNLNDYRDTLAFVVKSQSEIAQSDIFSLDTIISTYDLLTSFSNPETRKGLAKHTVSFSFCQKDKRLKICGLKVSINDKEKFVLEALDSLKVESSYCKITDSDCSYLKQRSNLYTNIFDIFNSGKVYEEQSTTLANYIISIGNIYLKYLKSEFNYSSIQHIKPLRANPQRYYVIDDEKLTPFTSTLDGDKLIEILRDNLVVKNKVNDWLKPYNLSIDIVQSEDVIHHIKIVQDNVELDIPDVGFGISQVLPILVQAYCSPKNTVTIIEQPEIHLHPILQADVADLLRQSASMEKPIIVETHSEYFLRRIRRRVATKEMSSSDVAIYLLSGKTKDRDYTEIKRLDMTETGTFEWPSDYYDGELYRDVIDYISAQSQSQSQLQSESELEIEFESESQSQLESE